METNDNMIQQKIDLLIEHWGRTLFFEMLDFIVGVMKADYEYKILMARRYLDIHLEFEEIIAYLYEEDPIDNRGEYITNLSMALYQNKLKGKRVLIIDDICIHGISLAKVYSFLTEKCDCKPEDIFIKIFVENKDAKKIFGIENYRIDYCGSADANLWRKISSSVINSFYITGQPYISYLPYCEFAHEADDNIKDLIAALDKKEISTEIQRYYGVNAYIHFVDEEIYHSDKKIPLVKRSMIRIYVYEKLKKVIFVPYAFLSPLSVEEVRSCYNVLKEQEIISDILLPEEEQGILQGNPYLNQYLYSLETYVISYILGRKFFESHNIHADWCKKMEGYSFHIEIDVSAGKVEECIQKLCEIFQNKVSCAKTDTDIQELFQKINNQYGCRKREENYGIIEDYIKRSAIRDEKYVERNEERMRGIGIQGLTGFLSDELEDETYCSIIKIADSGRATLMIDQMESDRGKYMDSLLLAGEQNFACNESNLKYFIYPLLEYECQFEKGLSSGERGDFLEFITLVNPELRDRVNDYEIDKLKNEGLVNSMDYYLNRYPVYENDHILQELLKKAKHYRKEKSQIYLFVNT